MSIGICHPWGTVVYLPSFNLFNLFSEGGETFVFL